MNISVVCEGGSHEPVSMHFVPSKLRYWCSQCGESVNTESIRRAVPEPYRPLFHASVLQAIADFDLRVISRNGEMRVEYPRPSLEDVHCSVDTMEANCEPAYRTPDLYRRTYERCPHCNGEDDCIGHGKWRR